jgi:hypothetical protein
MDNQTQKKTKKEKKIKKPDSFQPAPHGKPSPVDTANIFSLLSYHWVGKLLWHGYKSTITVIMT